MQSSKAISFLIGLTLYAFATFGQVPADSLILAKIKTAANDNSSIPETITNLADINGPRLLGAESYFRSAQWVRQKLIADGMDSVWFQSFDKQRRGWKVKSFNMEMTYPAYMHLSAYPMAYTQSTKGTITGEVVLLEHIEGFVFPFQAQQQNLLSPVWIAIQTHLMGS